MHTAVKKFIKQACRETLSKYGFNSFFRFKEVLEVGSANINGSPRRYFWWCKYTGIDILNGKGVDIVSKFSEAKLGVESFNVVISTEMLEHDFEWQSSLKKMYELLTPGGLLIITCAAPDRPEHGTNRTRPQDSPATTDYYRNISTDDFRQILPPYFFSTYILQYARGKNDLQFYGIKHKREYYLMMANYG